MQFFETIFLEEADIFVDSLDRKVQQKIFYNIRIAEQTNDPELFKKLNDDIWEFRIRKLNMQHELWKNILLKRRKLNRIGYETNETIFVV